MEVLTLDNH